MGVARRVVVVFISTCFVRCTCGSSAPPNPHCERLSAPNATFNEQGGACGDFCEMECDIGFLDCNNDKSDGCETNANSSSPPNTRLVDTGTCHVACKLGWSDCDGDKTNGCETSGKCPVDAGDAALACSPSPVDGGAITWTPPVLMSSCSTQQISDMFAACFATSASPASCDAWTNANSLCNACMRPADGSGPLFNDPYGDTWINVGACVAVVSGDTSPTGCGALYAKAVACEIAACDCPSGSFDDYNACLAAADTSTCASYASVECNLSSDAAPYETCFTETTFEQYVTMLGALLCSATTSDAGLDGTTD